MSVDLSFHRCTNVRVSHTYVSNSNSIQIVIEHDGGETEITMYDLPAVVTNKFWTLRDERTSDYVRDEAA